jgi:hypothetical protein
MTSQEVQLHSYLLHRAQQGLEPSFLQRLSMLCLAIRKSLHIARGIFDYFALKQIPFIWRLARGREIRSAAAIPKTKPRSRGVLPFQIKFRRQRQQRPWRQKKPGGQRRQGRTTRGGPQ